MSDANKLDVRPRPWRRMFLGLTARDWVIILLLLVALALLEGIWPMVLPDPTTPAELPIDPEQER